MHFILLNVFQCFEKVLYFLWWCGLIIKLVFRYLAVAITFYRCEIFPFFSFFGIYLLGPIQASFKHLVKTNNVAFFFSKWSLLGYTVDSKLDKRSDLGSILRILNANLRPLFFLFYREMLEKIRIRKTVDEWIKTISAEIQVGFGKNRIRWILR